MNPWLVIGLSIFLVTAALVVFSMVFTWLILKLAERHVRKMVKAYVSKVEALLPGTNCGKCGYDSCNECAEAMLRGQESPNSCREGKEGLDEEIFACIVAFQKLGERSEEEKKKQQKPRRSMFFRTIDDDMEY